MKKQQYINRVLTLLNETALTRRDAFEFQGADNSEVTAHITDVYQDAWRKAIAVAPPSWANIASFAEPPRDLKDGSGYLTLPDDWYKLYIFQMKGWKAEVYTAAEDGDETAKRQNGQFSRGTPLHPVCVLGYQDGNERTLRYYSLPRGIPHEIQKALYIPLCQIIDPLDNDAQLSLDERLQGVLCHFAASLISLRLENYNVAKVFESEAITLTRQTITQPQTTAK